MGAAVIIGKGMDFINDHRSKIAEDLTRWNLGAHQHRFYRFRSCQQDVSRIRNESFPFGGGDITVPFEGTAAQKPGVSFDTW